MPFDSKTRLDFCDKNIDCCARGELGLFCDIRFINDDLHQKISELEKEEKEEKEEEEFERQQETNDIERYS